MTLITPLVAFLDAADEEVSVRHFPDPGTLVLSRIKRDFVFVPHNVVKFWIRSSFWATEEGGVPLLRGKLVGLEGVFAEAWSKGWKEKVKSKIEEINKIYNYKNYCSVSKSQNSC